MPLIGQAKKDYQREYMRRRRSNNGSNNGSNNEPVAVREPVSVRPKVNTVRPARLSDNQRAYVQSKEAT